MRASLSVEVGLTKLLSFPLSVACSGLQEEGTLLLLSYGNHVHCGLTARGNVQGG